MSLDPKHTSRQNSFIRQRPKLREITGHFLHEAIQRHEGNLDLVASELGIGRRTIDEKIRKNEVAPLSSYYLSGLMREEFIEMNAAIVLAHDTIESLTEEVLSLRAMKERMEAMLKRVQARMLC